MHTHTNIMIKSYIYLSQIQQLFLKHKEQSTGKAHLRQEEVVVVRPKATVRERAELQRRQKGSGSWCKPQLLFYYADKKHLQVTFIK